MGHSPGQVPRLPDSVDARFLPFDQYAIVLDTTSSCRECVKVLGRAPWLHGARALDLAVQRYDQPLGWDERRARLWTMPSLNDPTKLQLTDPSVVDYLKDVLSARHTIWGIPLDPGLFFAVPGILLGAQALALLGALMSLKKRDGNAPSDQLWILVISTRFPPRPLLETLLVAVSLCWIVLPVAILAAQLFAGVQLHPFENLCLWLGAAGLSGATAFNTAEVFHLRRLRRLAVTAHG